MAKKLNKQEKQLFDEVKLAMKYGKDKWSNAAGTHWIAFDGHCYQITFWYEPKMRHLSVRPAGTEPEQKSFFEKAKNFVLDTVLDRPNQGFNIRVDSNPEIKYTGMQRRIMDLYRYKYLSKNTAR